MPYPDALVDNGVEVNVQVIIDRELLLGVSKVHSDERVPALKPELGNNYQR